ncbi:alpha/beta hydrolase family protein [Telmatospirillum siberiense]|uniref:Dienelactone hydrolase n=1 Tax=Telmatospirillum siberiense TaxID=382514 RepID=A0A2N3PN33_9PROT|nr:alpha/beta fold hydrolase [Telmatospirillum siberiense]PKU21804.1 dienelactone hydrolase [Telmatospirillum siberiense]
MNKSHLAAIVLTILGLCPAGPAEAVGFQWGTASDPDGKPLQLAIWYPSDDEAGEQIFGPFRQTVTQNGTVHGDHLPLIVLSHGTGGSLFNSHDSAIAFAKAGFVAVAVTHTGDNYQDQANSFTSANLTNRVRHVRRVIDYMLTDWSRHVVIDPARIGIFGHSAGGTTALVAIGGRAELGRLVAYCQDNPDDWGCNKARQRNGEALNGTPLPSILAPDRRIGAAVLMAPAMAAAFTPDGLASVRVPVQLWIAERDEVAPDAEQVAHLLPGPVEVHRIEGAGHFAFLSPCSDILLARAPEICTDPPGFDRPAFLADLQRRAITFFKRTLKTQ